MKPELIFPPWPAPANIKAAVTTRKQGFSLPPYNSFNLALHTHDNCETVKQNRALLNQSLRLNKEPFWLNQTHSTTVTEANTNGTDTNADASYTAETDLPCVVMTADCLPILLCNDSGSWVAAVHAGWKGLGSGIIGNTLKCYPGRPEELMAYIGPAIGANAYEVGNDVVDHILSSTSAVNKNRYLQQGFKPTEDNKFFCNLPALARLFLNDSGIMRVFGGEHCTLTEEDLFYSYRRDGQETGRIASLIWIGKS